MSRLIDPAPGLHRIQPSELLREFVRYYDYIEVLQRGPEVHPVTARVHTRMAFCLGMPLQAFEYDLQMARILPPVTVTGPLTGRVADVTAVGGVASVFSVTFEPTGFIRLFRVPPGVIINHAYDGVDVLGKSIKILHARLCEACGIGEMVKITEEMLLAQLKDGEEPIRWIQNAAHLLQQSGGRTDLAVIRNSSGLSDRQMRRLFLNQIGLTPKSFSQVLRFNNALDLKRRFPDRLWTQISLDAGYYDQSHMHADFMELAGEAPSRLIHTLSIAPGLIPP